MISRHQKSTLFPYTTLFRSDEYVDLLGSLSEECEQLARLIDSLLFLARAEQPAMQINQEPLDIARDVQWLLVYRSEEHTSELQSRGHLVCRLLLEKKKKELQ